MEDKTMTINELIDRIYEAKYIDELFDKLDDLTQE